MKRGIHDLSEADKRHVADELMMSTGVFAVLLVAALLFLAVFLVPRQSIDTADQVLYAAGRLVRPAAAAP